MHPIGQTTNMHACVKTLYGNASTLYRKLDTLRAMSHAPEGAAFADTTRCRMLMPELAH